MASHTEPTPPTPTPGGPVDPAASPVSPPVQGADSPPTPPPPTRAPSVPAASSPSSPSTPRHPATSAPPKNFNLGSLSDKYGRCFIERYALHYWIGKQQADCLCPATLNYLRRDRPTPFPADLLSEVVDRLDARGAPTSEDVLTFAAKITLSQTLDAKGGVSRLLVRKPPLPRSDRPICRVASLLGDEPTMTYVLISLRPLVMQCCHADVSCYSGISRTLCIVDMFYWWIRMEQYVFWWIVRCFKCHIVGIRGRLLVVPQLVCHSRTAYR